MIQDIKALQPGDKSWLCDRSEQTKESGWVRNKAHALKKLLIEHPFEPLSFSGQSTTELENFRNRTVEFFLNSEADTQIMAYQVQLVQDIIRPVQEYWLRIHRIYPLPAKLVQTQQYQLQQWYNQFKTKR